MTIPIPPPNKSSVYIIACGSEALGSPESWLKQVRTFTQSCTYMYILVLRCRLCDYLQKYVGTNTYNVNADAGVLYTSPVLIYMPGISLPLAS